MDLNYQFAHHSHSESETKSSVSSEEVIAAFDNFNWPNEVEKANKLHKCSPTLSILANGPEEMVWVSGYGDANNIEFVSECYFPGQVSKLFGLYKGPGTVNLSTQSFSLAQARKAIELFLYKNYDGLRELYA
ncbi:hypothetical protein TDB9533_03909 [Thalassocella blandensis]|nr:hypothetical protein TDB9533_03909 [Thalassocella blandensis]